MQIFDFPFEFIFSWIITTSVEGAEESPEATDGPVSPFVTGSISSVISSVTTTRFSDVIFDVHDTFATFDATVTDEIAEELFFDEMLDEEDPVPMLKLKRLIRAVNLCIFV